MCMLTSRGTDPSQKEFRMAASWVKSLTVFFFGLAALGAQAQAPAGPYPNRPIKLIVPYAAGGGTDTIARVIAQGISQAIGRSSHSTKKARQAVISLLRSPPSLITR